MKFDDIIRLLNKPALIFMKTFYSIIILSCIITLSSCKDKAAEASEVRPISFFDSSFPKKNKNLADILGEELTIKTSYDTLNLRIISTKNDNLIVNSETGDTLFFGKVSKYRGLYYFNEKENDSMYYVNAVKISGNLIYGFPERMQQLYGVDALLMKGNHKKLVKYFNPDTTKIRLHPDKREMKKLFSSIIAETIPDTILNYRKSVCKSIANTETVTAIEPDEFNNILKVYPNPASDFINVELQQKSKSLFQLADINGRTILQGQLNELVNKIELGNQRAGIYLLTIINAISNERETVKIIING